MSETMTKSDRSSLERLVRKREKVMKSVAAERAAQMMAEYDEKSATIFSFDQDETWSAATQEAQKAVDAANKVIAQRCKRLGIPPEFAPSLSFGWMGRGQNAVISRRVELRRMAMSRVKAIEAEACQQIERLSLTAQTEIIAGGLDSKAARDFLDNMPKMDDLMPSLDVKGLKMLQDSEYQKRRKYEG